MFEIFNYPEVTLESLFMIFWTSIGVMLAVVGSIYLERYLKRKFNIKPRVEVEGYINKQYVHKIHKHGADLLVFIFVFLLLFGVNDWLLKNNLLLIKIAIAIIPFLFLFHTFMQWKYPVQRNEYKKSTVYFFISFIIAILFIIIP